MEAMNCPYCGRENHSSCPEVMAGCAYCGRQFAQVNTEFQQLIILDNSLENSAQVAAELASQWQEKGKAGKKAIVDRRHNFGQYQGPERRRLSNIGWRQPTVLSLLAPVKASGKTCTAQVCHHVLIKYPERHRAGAAAEQMANGGID